MRRAAFFSAAGSDGGVQCRLCPRRCRIADGACGFCRVRRNVGGVLYSTVYGRPAAVNIDPIEKKPLAEFMPGTRTLSLGTFGCNFNCPWCQNSELSRGACPEPLPAESLPPEAVVELARKHHCPSISYTYNEPTVFYEYMLDCARMARAAGLANVMVSNAGMELEPARELLQVIDAANFDMKGFDAEFYRRECGVPLDGVLDVIALFHRAGVHVEVTTLVIPGLNDAPEMMAGWLDWAERNLSLATPLHFTAYFPCYRCDRPATPAETLYRIREQAERRGFNRVSLGNLR